MSHSKEEQEKEDINCLIDHTKILMETLQGLRGVVSKTKVIKELKQIKKRVDYMLKEELGVDVGQ